LKAIKNLFIRNYVMRGHYPLFHCDSGQFAPDPTFDRDKILPLLRELFPDNPIEKIEHLSEVAQSETIFQIPHFSIDVLKSLVDGWPIPIEDLVPNSTGWVGKNDPVNGKLLRVKIDDRDHWYTYEGDSLTPSTDQIVALPADKLDEADRPRESAVPMRGLNHDEEIIRDAQGAVTVRELKEGILSHLKDQGERHDYAYREISVLLPGLQDPRIIFFQTPDSGYQALYMDSLSDWKSYRDRIKVDKYIPPSREVYDPGNDQDQVAPSPPSPPACQSGRQQRPPQNPVLGQTKTFFQKIAQLLGWQDSK